MRENTRFPSEIRRPDLLLRQVRERHPFDRPETLLVRVEVPYDQQRLVDGLVLWDDPAQDEHERTLQTKQALQRRGLGFTEAPYPQWPIVVPVVTARGWISHLDGLNGAEPRAAWAALPTAKATS